MKAGKREVKGTVVGDENNRDGVGMNLRMVLLQYWG